jgi:hypothetical protein
VRRFPGAAALVAGLCLPAAACASRAAGRVPGLVPPEAVRGVSRGPGAPGAPAAPALPCPCPQPRAWRATAGAQARWLFPSGDMRITLGGEPLTGTTVDLRSDLALDPTVAPRATAAVEWRGHRVHGWWERFAFEGEATLDRDVVFHGRTFPAGDRVDSEVSLEHGLLGWEGRLACGRCGDLWAGVGAYVWRFDSRVESEVSGIVEERGFSHAFPVATASASRDLGGLDLVARVAAGGLATDRYVVDAEAGVERRFLRDRLALRLSWALHLLEFHETTNEATLLAHGPALSLSFDF